MQDWWYGGSTLKPLLIGGVLAASVFAMPYLLKILYPKIPINYAFGPLIRIEIVCYFILFLLCCAIVSSGLVAELCDKIIKPYEMSQEQMTNILTERAEGLTETEVETASEGVQFYSKSLSTRVLKPTIFFTKRYRVRQNLKRDWFRFKYTPTPENLENLDNSLNEDSYCLTR